MKRLASPAPFANCGAFEQSLRRNPFSVLELPLQASRAEAERAAGRWLALLEIGNEKANSYPTPFGPETRTPEAVREALAQLRDPLARVAAECWAQALASLEPGAAAPPAWPDAFGWLRRGPAK